MSTSPKTFRSGRYGVLGFDKDGSVVVGKKALSPTEEAAKAAERFRERLEEDFEGFELVPKTTHHQTA